MSIFNIFKKYDEYGFDSKGVHKNGTKYDENGYDRDGHHKNGTYFNDEDTLIWICNMDMIRMVTIIRDMISQDIIDKDDF